jgi:hypothetical protein
MDDWGGVALNLCNVKITSKTVFAKCSRQQCGGLFEFAADCAGTQSVCPHCGSHAGFERHAQVWKIQRARKVYSQRTEWEM